jgi:hypothetical protein
LNGKMEEDVKPKDEDGVDGWGVSGWDGLLGGLGAVGASLTFGVVRGAGTFAAVLPTFVLVSGIHLAQRYRGNIATSFSAASSSRREAMVGGALARVSVFRVGLGVGGTVVASGSRDCPSHSCDDWVCYLGAVGVSLTFWVVRGAGSFAAVLPTFVLVSGIHLAQRYRGNIVTSFSAASSSRREAMVGGALARVSAFRVGLGVSGATIVSGSCARPSLSRISRCLTSSLSLGISSLFCRATQCM